MLVLLIEEIECETFFLSFFLFIIISFTLIISDSPHLPLDLKNYKVPFTI